MQEAVKKVREYIKKGRWHDYLVVLPTSELRDYFIKELLAEEIEGMFYPNIYTFDSFVDEILHRENIFPRTASSIGRHELMRRAAPGYSYGIVENFLSAAAELKKAGILPEFLREISEKEEFSSLRDLAEKYRAYLEVLAESGWEEAEDKYVRARELIAGNKARMLKNIDYFYADRFFDLTPLQEDILKETARRAKESEVYILPAGEADLKKFREQERWLPPEGNHVARYIFTGRKAEDVYPHLEILAAAGREGEARGAVRIVKEHLDRGKRLEDIAVVCRYPEKYAPFLSRVCDRAGLPLALDVKRPLSASLLMKNLVSLLKLRMQMEKGFPFSELLDLPFIFPASLASRLDGQMELRYPFAEIKDMLNENGDEELRYMLDVLEKLSLIPREGTCREMGEAVKAWLDELSLTENILSLPEGPGLRERFSLAGRDLRALEKLGEILEQMAEADALRDKKVSLPEFIYRLELYLKNTSYVYAPGQPGGLKVLPPGDMRGLSFPVVIILGLDEGTFPIKPENSWVIRDKERSLLKGKYGIYLASSRDIYRREKILFYLALGAAREKVYLMYPSCDEEGEELLPSSFINAVVEAVPEPLLPRESKPWLSYEEQLSLLASCYPEEAASCLEEGGMPESLVASVRQGKPFRAQDSFMSGEALSYLAARYRDRTWSVSQLDSYIKCPLQYFFGYELDLKTREEERDDLSPLASGILQHEILCSFFTWWKDEGFPLLGEEEVKKRLDEELRDKKPPEKVHKSVWEIRKEEISERLARLVVEEMKRGQFRPEHMEREFLARLREESGEAMKISVKVDRIDRLEEEGESVYAVYDYKNSENSIPGRQAALNLASLQLPLYVMAVQEALKGEVAGAGYINLKKAETGTVLPKEGWKVKLLGKGSHAREVPAEEWQDWLKRARNRALEIREDIAGKGFFPPLPHPAWPNTCQYCAFASICFYR